MGIEPAADGAKLQTAFQKLSGTATREGLWLESTSEKGGRLRVIADSIGRVGDAPPVRLAPRGSVTTGKDVVTFTRPALVEEYSVSVDGVRQDFVVTQRPSGIGKLCVELALDGGCAEAATYGAKITLDGSGRVLAYSRLKAMDAQGRELRATMHVTAAHRLQVCVDDAGAAYPVRIDPTFSDASWVSLNPGVPGVNGNVNALVVDAHGNLYVGGSFNCAGATATSDIAMWNGTQWSALGSGMDGTVYALALDAGGNLFAGGSFTSAGGVAASSIAEWNPTTSTWSRLDGGISGTVLGITFDSNGNLYAVGTIFAAGGIAASNIAKWNGTAWSALGAGLTGLGAYADCVAVDASGNVYAGGRFTAADGVSADNIAMWNGSSWSPVGGGVTDQVYALTMDTHGNLYAGGAFTFADGTRVNHVAMWNGTTWSTIGAGADNNVRALAVDASGNIYIGGDFDAASGLSANYVAMWNGSSWSGLGSGAGFEVTTLALDASGHLLIGGSFLTAGGVPASNVARWNGNAWSSLGPAGMNSAVQALVPDGHGNLYVGGSFTTVGTINANYIAKWDGSTWSALGSGASSPVLALALDASGNLYAGGEFFTAGGVQAPGVAKWNGNTWSALDSGVNGAVTALMVDTSGNVYAGGLFTTAGGKPVNYVAKWNGSAWSALGSGTDNSVLALAVDASGNVYAGGDFDKAGGVTMNNIAMWNGSAWSALGSGIAGGVVSALVMDTGGNLYAGGNFGTATGAPGNNVVRWDGSAWSTLGSGIAGNVNTLTLDAHGNLYAGGYFGMAGGVSANYIAVWNGSAWSSMGSGVNSGVMALATDAQGNVYLGGVFSLAGATFSPFLVEATAPSKNANLSSLTLSTGTLSPAFDPGTTSYMVSVPGTTTSVTLNPAAADPNATVTINGVAFDPFAEPLNLNPGNNLETIVVTAADGATLQTYTVNVFRAAVTQKWVQSYTSASSDLFSQANAVTVDSAGNVIMVGYATQQLSQYAYINNCYVAKYGGTDGTLLWENRFQGSPQGSGGYAVAVDSKDNVLVTGNNGLAFFTAKYAAASGTMLWQQSYTGANDSVDENVGQAIAVDHDDNVVATGYSNESFRQGYYTAKYAGADGTLLWDARYQSPDGFTDTGDATAVAIDSSNNVIVTGTSPSANGDDYYTAKYAAADGTLLWGVRYNGPGDGDDIAFSVAVDPSDNVVVTGGSDGDGENDMDYYTAKYAAADGSLLWEKRYNGPGSGIDEAGKVVVDGHGDVIVSGTSIGADNQQDIYTAKYAGADGSLLWEQRYDGPGSALDFAAGLVVAPNGNVVISGATDTPVQGTQFSTSSSYVAEYAAADGALLWQENYVVPNGGSFFPSGNNLALLPNGGVVVAGYSSTAGEPQMFTTLVYGLPTPNIMTGTASNIGASTVTLNGMVNPNGSSTTAQFQYGLTSSYGSSSGIGLSPNDGSDPQAVSVTLTGLTPGTLYHYQISASNGVGSISGSDLTFTTLSNFQSWRQQYFGSAANSGNGADTANPANDGIPNLIKFATNLDPTMAEPQPGTAVASGSNLVFTYSRSDTAMADGLTFTVQWSSTLPGTSWSNTGVTEQILSDDGTTQQVKAFVPIGSNGSLFVHLTVSAP